MAGTPQSGAAPQEGREARTRTPNRRFSTSPAGTPSGALLLERATSKQGSTPRAGAAPAAPAARAAKAPPAHAKAPANGAFKPVGLPVGLPGLPPRPLAKPRGLAPALAAPAGAAARSPPAAAPQEAALDPAAVMATAQQRVHDLTAPVPEPPPPYAPPTVKRKRYVWRADALAYAVGLVR